MRHVRKKDKVLVISGRSKGKRGEVVEVDDAKGRVMVSKVNMVKRHTRPRPTQPGGIVEKEAFLPLSAVMLLCPKCDQPTRSKYGSFADGLKGRICRRCGETIA